MNSALSELVDVIAEALVREFLQEQQDSGPEPSTPPQHEHPPETER